MLFSPRWASCKIATICSSLISPAFILIPFDPGASAPFVKGKD